MSTSTCFPNSEWVYREYLFLTKSINIQSQRTYLQLRAFYVCRGCQQDGHHNHNLQIQQDIIIATNTTRQSFVHLHFTHIPRNAKKIISNIREQKPNKCQKNQTTPWFKNIPVFHQPQLGQTLSDFNNFWQKKCF